MFFFRCYCIGVSGAGRTAGRYDCLCTLPLLGRPLFFAS